MGIQNLWIMFEYGNFATYNLKMKNMNKRKILFFILAIVAVFCQAEDSINGEGNGRIVFDSVKIPVGRFSACIEPEAQYSPSLLTVYLDPVYYSHYTIILQSDYASLDYIVTSPVVNIPVGSLDSVVDIYIESDDCGSYYGVLDQSAYGSTF